MLFDLLLPPAAVLAGDGEGADALRACDTPGRYRAGCSVVCPAAFDDLEDAVAGAAGEDEAPMFERDSSA